MTQAIEENTKAVNRLTNTLLTIFNVQAIALGASGGGGAAVPAVKTGPDGGAGNPGKAAGAPPAPKAGASTDKAEKTQPAAATQAAAPIPMVRETASKLTLHLASSTAEGQGKQVAIDLLAEYIDADGNPCKGAKFLKEADLPAYLGRVIGIIGEAQARTVLGIK